MRANSAVLEQNSSPLETFSLFFENLSQLFTAVERYAIYHIRILLWPTNALLREKYLLHRTILVLFSLAFCQHPSILLSPQEFLYHSSKHCRIRHIAENFHKYFSLKTWELLNYLGFFWYKKVMSWISSLSSSLSSNILS